MKHIHSFIGFLVSVNGKDLKDSFFPNSVSYIILVIFMLSGHWIWKWPYPGVMDYVVFGLFFLAASYWDVYSRRAKPSGLQNKK
jgi:hypothetical protein